jgi:hypothetical protein
LVQFSGFGMLCQEKSGNPDVSQSVRLMLVAIFPKSGR